jgi:2-polyprenyl-6-methoxyphenol hydroxylase-like FAD-dependent oxidoreductase
MTVLICGAGIGGLCLGLSLQQLNIPFQIFESSDTIEPLGVGINLQPNAVRELSALGIKDDLKMIGIETEEFGLFSKRGLEIWTEPRGLKAGYNVPQFSVHRGKLQKFLYNTLIGRMEYNPVKLGMRATGYKTLSSSVQLNCINKNKKKNETFNGDILVACDGINSVIRKQLFPNEGEPLWNGAILWRGLTLACPFRTGASMVMIGHDTQRFVSYPISSKDNIGNAEINWIAELKFNPKKPWSKSNWSKRVDKSKFIDSFLDWSFHWINPIKLISEASSIYEYPMVDRDPLPNWTFERTTLLGDAAHPTYPVGSNGASQAIIDARKLAFYLKVNGVNKTAISNYEKEMLPLTTNITLANRNAGPDALLQVVEDRCGGSFSDIREIISQNELKVHSEKYKSVAGLNIERLNNSEGILNSLI